MILDLFRYPGPPESHSPKRLPVILEEINESFHSWDGKLLGARIKRFKGAGETDYLEVLEFEVVQIGNGRVIHLCCRNRVDESIQSLSCGPMITERILEIFEL